MKILVALVAVALAGCATETVWRKNGSTNDDWYTDSGQCRAQAFSVPGVPLMQTAIVYSSCLQGKGWYQAQVPR